MVYQGIGFKTRWRSQDIHQNLRGIPTVYPSFFLGIAPGNKDDESTAKTVVDDITFYIESGNEWIVDNHDLTVEYNGQDVDYRFSD